MSLRQKLAYAAGVACVVVPLAMPALNDSPTVREAWSHTFKVPMITEIEYLSYQPGGALWCAHVSHINNYSDFIDRLAAQRPGFITREYSASQNCEGGWLVQVNR